MLWSKVTDVDLQGTTVRCRVWQKEELFFRFVSNFFSILKYHWVTIVQYREANLPHHEWNTPHIKMPLSNYRTRDSWYSTRAVPQFEYIHVVEFGLSKEEEYFSEVFIKIKYYERRFFTKRDRSPGRAMIRSCVKLLTSSLSSKWPTVREEGAGRRGEHPRP